MDDKSGKKKKLKCYIYTRVSTWMQVDGYSLDAQRNRLISEAEHRGMAVAREFTDEGKSGKNTTGRPEFTEMIRLIGNGNPDDVRYVLVFKLSRFGRNAADVLSNLQLMQDNGVDLICVEDGIDSSSPAGKILFPVWRASPNWSARISRPRLRPDASRRPGRANGTAGRPPWATGSCGTKAVKTVGSSSTRKRPSSSG